MNNGQITASDDTLMAVMQNNYFATPFYYISIANIETSATFESKKSSFLVVWSDFLCVIFALAVNTRKVSKEQKTLF